MDVIERGNVLLQNGRHAEAAAEYDTIALSAQRRNDTGLVRTARFKQTLCLVLGGRNREAAAIFRELLSDSLFDQALLPPADIAFGRGRHDTVLQTIERINGTGDARTLRVVWTTWNRLINRLMDRRSDRDLVRRYLDCFMRGRGERPAERAQFARTEERARSTRKTLRDSCDGSRHTDGSCRRR